MTDMAQDFQVATGDQSASKIRKTEISRNQIVMDVMGGSSKNTREEQRSFNDFKLSERNLFKRS